MGWRAVPLGYEPAVIGVAVFALGGLGDLIWHLMFGIEIDLEALLSPTHMLLALGGGLIVSGPLRAAWSRTGERPGSLREFLPVLLSTAMVLSTITFMTQYVHPFGTTWASAMRRPEIMFGAAGAAEASTGVSVLGYLAFFEQLATLAGIVVQTVILTGIILTLLRRWILPFGSITFIMTVNAVLLTVMRDVFLDTGPLPLIAVAVVGGLAADLLAARLKPFDGGPAGLRVFATLVPAMLYTLYLLALAVAAGGIWWRVHLWMGAVTLAGITGWLVSYLVVPPQALDYTQAGGAR